MNNNSIQFPDENNPFFNWEKEINNINFNKTADGKSVLPEDQQLSPNMSSTLREIMLEMKSMTVDVKGVVVYVGLKALSFVFEAMRRFPNTACGLLIVATLHGITSTIPFFGHVLNALLVPLDVLIIGSSVLKDILNSVAFGNLMSSCSAAANKMLNK